MSEERKTVLIAGASGLIGRALGKAVVARGNLVRRLVRRPARNADEASWNPGRGEIDAAAMEGVDAVVNLSGENVGAGRWTKGRKEAILRSRVDATRTLVEAIRRAAKKPEVLVNASAVGIYGDRGEDVLNEGAIAGTGFLADVCRAWEGEARAAERDGVRVAILRLGVVLTAEGGALAKMLPVFRTGLGGRLGNGKQWMSWVSFDDAIAGFVHAIETPGCQGVFNLVAPEPVTNREFTRALARALKKPAVLPVPAVAIRAVLGQMGNEALLASVRAVPERLLAGGFEFGRRRIEDALRAAVTRRR